MCQVSLLSGTICSPACVIVTQDGGGDGTVTHTTSQIGEGHLYESQIRGSSNHHPERGIEPVTLPPQPCNSAPWYLFLLELALSSAPALSDYLCKEKGLEEPSPRSAGGIPGGNP